jgi:hypothetical protein
VTLEKLRRSSLSIYYMALPDPLTMKAFDYRDVIPSSLDMRIIANKLLRGKYQDDDAFELDMVTMIQNSKVYFVIDMEMYDIAIQFEELFWKTWENKSMHK